MTIEMMRGGSEWVYRQDPKDPRNVLRRPNQAGAKWVFYLRRDSIPEARRALLQLQEGEEQPDDE